jgi:hypothetical protein
VERLGEEGLDRHEGTLIAEHRDILSLPAWDTAGEGTAMLYEVVQRTARLLSDPRWWEPLVHPTCSRCSGRIAPTQRRVVDGLGATVNVMHLACVLRRTAKPLGRDVDDPATGSSSVDPWARRQRVRERNDAMLRRSEEARAGGHRVLSEIAKLVRMLQRDIPEA